MGGSRHAFLDVETINYIRWRDPTLTKQMIIDMYLQNIPDVSTLGSCVYHGEQGCTLNREIRADICNSFQCPARRALIKEHQRKPDNGAVVAGIARTHVDDPSAGAPYMRVVSVSADNEVRVHTHLTLPRLIKGMDMP